MLEDPGLERGRIETQSGCAFSLSGWEPDEGNPPASYKAVKACQ
jgi:hypothetical protein